MQDHQGYLDCTTLPSLQHLMLHKLCIDVLSRYEIRGKKEAAFDILITKCSGQSVSLIWGKGHCLDHSRL